MSVYVRGGLYRFSSSNATFASCDTLGGSAGAPVEGALAGRPIGAIAGRSLQRERRRTGDQAMNRPVLDPKSSRGEAWGDGAKLMRLVPLTAQDRTANARDLRPGLFLTAPTTGLTEVRAGR